MGHKAIELCVVMVHKSARIWFVVVHKAWMCYCYGVNLLECCIVMVPKPTGILCCYGHSSWTYYNMRLFWVHRPTHDIIIIMAHKPARVYYWYDSYHTPSRIWYCHSSYTYHVVVLVRFIILSEYIVIHKSTSTAVCVLVHKLTDWKLGHHLIHFHDAE